MDKEQYDIVKGAMDIHAENISILFTEWYINNEFYRGACNYWYDKHGEGIAETTKQLFQKFKQEICKNVNQDVSVNSIQKQENL